MISILKKNFKVALICPALLSYMTRHTFWVVPTGYGSKISKTLHWVKPTVLNYVPGNLTHAKTLEHYKMSVCSPGFDCPEKLVTK